MTLAREAALDAAMAARTTCPVCRRRYHYVLPLRTLGSCLECWDGTPADPSTYIAPRPTHQLAAERYGPYACYFGADTDQVPVWTETGAWVGVADTPAELAQLLEAFEQRHGVGGDQP
ncbi:hypothetical protein CJI59_22140 [Streptomyces sp. Alain-F2R5]|nr:hypothetical protein CJI59_22140 [Streptomyces sp. Alain-F2R5]